MEYPLVSVIIPVFNRKNTIYETLISVVSQSYLNLEIVVVDDGSTDGSQDVIKKFINDYSDSRKFVYIYQNNQGVSVARNVGLEKANGVYVCFLDSDDSFYSRKIELQVKNILDTNGDLSIASFEMNNIDRDFVQKYIVDSKKDVLEKYVNGANFFHTSSYLISKQLLEDNKIIFRAGCSWGEDVEFFTKVLLHAQNICYVKEVLHIYNFQKCNSLSKFKWEQIDSDIVVWNNILCYLKDRCCKSRYHYFREQILGWRIPCCIISKFYEGRNDVEYFLKYFMSYSKYYSSIRYVNGYKSIKLFVKYVICLIIYLRIMLLKR